MKALRWYLDFIDQINEWAGRLTGVVLIALMLLVTSDVFLRYFLNMPIIWAKEVNGVFLLAVTFLAGGYTLLYDGHVRVDIAYNKLSANGRVVADLITHALLLSIVSVVLIWFGGKQTWEALINGYVSTSARPLPLWPGQILIPIGGLLIGLQGLAKWIRGLLKLVGKVGVKSDVALEKSGGNKS